MAIGNARMASNSTANVSGRSQCLSSFSMEFLREVPLALIRSLLLLPGAQARQEIGRRNRADVNAGEYDQPTD